MCVPPFLNNLRVPKIKCGGQLSAGLSSATEFGKQATKATSDDKRKQRAFFWRGLSLTTENKAWQFWREF
jgi:hypothetical protein